MPAIDAGMNKTPPPAVKGGGKGSKDDKSALMLGQSDTDEQKLLTRIRKRMDLCIQAEADNRKQALEDLKFKSGDQWPADVAAQRNFDRRPCITVNRLPTFVHQITNDQRQNRPAIDVSPVGDKGDVEVAKMYRGLIRAIERESTADISYDTAFDGAVSNGFGYWRIVTEYESPDTFDQVIRVQRIRNPFTVYLDPNSQEPDGADAKYGFVTEMIPKGEFEELYPEANPIPFSQGGVGESFKNWINQDTIRIAEYFEIVYKKRWLLALSNGHEGWEDELDDETCRQIAAGKITVLRERESDSPSIKWYKVTAIDVLEEQDWLGKWIPIVKVIGDEIDIEGKVKLSGVIRNAKGPQQLYNYWRTSEAELVALAPKAPWIMEEGQVEGHESSWKTANVKSNPYLLYRAVNVNGKPTPPPQRQGFAQIPAGVVGAAQAAAQDMMATTGIRFDATVAERVTDESGRAMRELKRNSDIGSFHYIDNLARSLKHSGRIMIDLIPKIYDTKRMMTILREDDSEERVQIDPNLQKPMMEARQGNGKMLKIFNPTYGEYGVTVTIGPSYATKRIEAAESMMDFAQALPNTAQLIADLIAKNQDWPGAQEMAARLAKAVPPNLLTPDQKDVPPQVQAMMQAMDGQIKQLTQERQQLIMALNEKQSDRAQRQDEIDKSFEAKLMKIIADVEAKAEATHEKAVSNFNTHIGAQINELGKNVTMLMQSLEHPAQPEGSA